MLVPSKDKIIVEVIENNYSPAESRLNNFNANKGKIIYSNSEGHIVGTNIYFLSNSGITLKAKEKNLTLVYADNILATEIPEE